MKLLEFPSFSVLLASLLFFFMVVKFLKKSKSKLPPGPTELPLIGNLHQLASSTLPHRSLRELAEKHGPLMHLKLGEISAIVISSAEAAEAALKTHELSFSQRPILVAVDVMAYGGSGVVFSPYGKYWRQLRKIITTELLSVKRVRSFRTVREEEVWNFIDSISSSAGHSINLTEKIYKLTSCITSRAMFGKECKDASEFVKVVTEGSELGGGFDLPELFPSLKFLHFISSTKPALQKLHTRLDRLLDNIITEHKSKGGIKSKSSTDDDLVDMLLQLLDSDDLEFPFTTTDIKAIILDIFGAGTDTTATTTEWAMAELLKHPTIMEKAQAEVRKVLEGKSKICEEDIQELNYLRFVIKETLRLHPPAPLAPRESRETCEIDEYEIPMKTKVIINLWAIGRDPNHWEDADCFRPERFDGSSIDYKGTNFQYIPFGSGRRMCPGISFGISTVEYQLALMLYHFNWELPNGMKPQELNMTEVFGATVKKKDPLCLTASQMS
ncbi:hypothetical protein RJ639_005468 [Escallonia herrerae]|uniref:Cytochrome P450 n=1 Tax=Escallonia herrerae TaxID=1293975 RepID=A0AA88VX11_9ASTE|nr:hypothetical protein RJ639_005468 [Escallonia herrerae]